MIVLIVECLAAEFADDTGAQKTPPPPPRRAARLVHFNVTSSLKSSGLKWYLGGLDGHQEG